MQIDIKSKIEGIINNQDFNEQEVLLKLKRLIFEADLESNLISKSKTIDELVAENLKHLQDNTEQRFTIKTGFTELDKMYGGLKQGELVVVGGRPGMGKTQLLVNVALNVSVDNPVLYFTLELSEFLLSARFVSSLTGIAVKNILQNELLDNEKESLATIETKFANHKIFINDSCNYSVLALKDYCKKHIEENGVKVIILDYLQLISYNKYRNNRELEISFISRELKNIAKEFNVCVIVSSQLSRAVESRGGSRHPQLSDLRESGAIEQNADKVFFIYRPEYYGLSCDEDGNDTNCLVELIVAKNRNGVLGTVKLLRDKNFTNFSDCEGFKKEFLFENNRLDELT